MSLADGFHRGEIAWDSWDSAQGLGLLVVGWLGYARETYSTDNWFGYKRADILRSNSLELCF